MDLRNQQLLLQLRDIYKSAVNQHDYEAENRAISLLMSFYDNTPELQEEFILPSDFIEWAVE